jgi:hypothetical protein
MNEEEYMYIIGMGSSEDWKRGKGSLYWVEDKRGERCLLAFTTPEGASEHAEANFNNPKSHMEMLESVADTPEHAAALTRGRYIVMPVSHELLVKTALRLGADYIQRDIRPGSEQEILRLDD